MPKPLAAPDLFGLFPILTGSESQWPTSEMPASDVGRHPSTLVAPVCHQGSANPPATAIPGTFK